MASFVRVGEELPAAPAPAPWRQESWAEQIEKAIVNGANYLLSAQADEGYWLGELEADTTLESDYIFYLHVLGKARSATHRQARELCSPAPIGRWRLEYLFRRPVGAECHGQSLFCPEARGRFARLAAHASGARGAFMNSAAWKRPIPTRVSIWRWLAPWVGIWCPQSRRS